MSITVVYLERRRRSITVVYSEGDAGASRQNASPRVERGTNEMIYLSNCMTRLVKSMSRNSTFQDAYVNY
jgi:hypothetical protein